MEAKRETRFQLISYVNSTMEFEDTSLESLTARVVLVTDLGSNPSELMASSCLLLQSIIKNILSAAADINIAIFALEGVLGVLDSCDQVYAGGVADVGGLRSQSVLSSTSSLDNNNLLRSSFKGLASKAMLEGEKDKVFIDTYLRSSVSKNNAADNSEQVIPQTSLEKVFSVAKSSLQLTGVQSARNSSDSFSRSIFLDESDLRFYLNSSDYTSNPLKVGYFLSSLTAQTLPPTASTPFVIVTFQNNAPQEYVTNSSLNNTTDEGTRYVTNCAFANISAAMPSVMFIYTCPSGDVVSHDCSDTEVVFTSVCPPRLAIPVCRILSSSAQDTLAPCEMVSFTPSYVICNCTVPLTQSTSDSTGSNRRRLYASSTVESSGFLEMVAMTEYTYQGFVQTNSDVSKVSLGDIQNGLIVIIMFSTLWGCGVLGLYELLRTSYCQSLSKVVPDESKVRLKRPDNANYISLDSKKKYLMTYIDSIIPVVFRSAALQHDSSLKSMWKTIKTYHPYAIVFTANGPGTKEVKVQKGIYLLTIQAMLMFIMAVFCDFQVINYFHMCIILYNMMVYFYKFAQFVHLSVPGG
jgi:hypothetical protein